MLCLDVNVLVGALNEASADHEAYRDRLQELVAGTEPLAVPDVVASGYLRIVTNRRIYDEPTRPSDAWAALDALLSEPRVQLLRPGPAHWAHFQSLASTLDAAGNDVPDAFIAAYAIENGATLLSNDVGFARFDGLSWRRPLDV